MTSGAPSRPLAATLGDACQRWADRPAITYRGSTMTYAEIHRRMAALAASYRRLGIQPGDRIVCQIPNTTDHVVAIGAAWACGAIHAGTDNDLTGGELAWLVENTGAAALLFQPRAGAADPFAPLAVVRAASPATRIIVSGAAEGDEPAGTYRIDDLTSGPTAGPGTGPTPALQPPQYRPEDTALLLLTSGTTGRPKGVMESIQNCWAKMQFFADAFGPGPDDVHLVFLPMGHVFGMRLALMALLSGGRLVLTDRFSPTEALRLVTDERVTVLPGMPAHFTLMLGALDTAVHDVASLRWGVSAASALPRPLAEQIYERLGVELLFVYGCSEGFTTLTTDRAEILDGSVGNLVFRGPEATAPDGTVAILDTAEGRVLPAGEVGEIAFGASRPVRYWSDPEVAADGWYHTGDLGSIDAEGRVYIVGRLKELVNRGGLKVSPTEVEVAMIRHPGVRDAAVVATPDPVLGEAVCACIVAGGASPPKLGDLRDFLAATLARHKLPDELCLVDTIPRTNIGKVDRAALAATVSSEGYVRERLQRR